MLAIFWYFYGAQTILISGCLISAFMISRSEYAPTVTYRIMSLGFLVFLFRQLHTLSYTNNITHFLASQEKASVIINQLSGCIGYLLIIVALIIKLANLRHLSETKNDMG